MFLPLKWYWKAFPFLQPHFLKPTIAILRSPHSMKKKKLIHLCFHSTLLSTSISVGFITDLSVCMLNTNINTQPNSCENIHDTFLWNVRGRDWERENIGTVMEMLCTHHLQIATDNLQCCHTCQKRPSISVTFLPMLSFSLWRSNRWLVTNWPVGCNYLPNDILLVLACKCLEITLLIMLKLNDSWLNRMKWHKCESKKEWYTVHVGRCNTNKCQ